VNRLTVRPSHCLTGYGPTVSRSHGLTVPRSHRDKVGLVKRRLVPAYGPTVSRSHRHYGPTGYLSFSIRNTAGHRPVICSRGYDSAGYLLFSG